MENDIKLTRTKLHENAMICLYQHLFYATLEKKYRKLLPEIITDVMEVPFDECDDFFKKIVFLAVKNKKEYVEIISNHLAAGWKFNRLSLIERAILLLFTSEIINNLVECHVAIDVGVDLAKRYCDDNSYKFINAILDKIGLEYTKK